MSEVVDGSVEAKSPLHLWQFTDIIDYYEGIKQPGYAECAAEISLGISAIVQAHQEGSQISVSRKLPLFPKSPNSAGVAENQTAEAKEVRLGQRLYYKGELNAETQNLMLMTESVLAAKILHDTRDETGRGKVVSQAEYAGAQVFLVENYDVGKLGEYLTWTVRSYLPKEFAMAKPKPVLALVAGEPSRDVGNWMIIDDFQSPSQEVAIRWRRQNGQDRFDLMVTTEQGTRVHPEVSYEEVQEIRRGAHIYPFLAAKIGHEATVRALGLDKAA